MSVEVHVFLANFFLIFLLIMPLLDFNENLKNFQMEDWTCSRISDPNHGYRSNSKYTVYSPYTVLKTL